jgi:hypothetical protein
MSAGCQPPAVHPSYGTHQLIGAALIAFNSIQAVQYLRSFQIRDAVCFSTFRSLKCFNNFLVLAAAAVY